MSSRILATALAVLLISIPLALVAGGESWNKTASFRATGNVNQFFRTTHHGAPFSAQKIAMTITSDATVAMLTLTMYVPAGSGPATATDSLQVYLAANQYGPGQVVYYFHRSAVGDSLRLSGDGGVGAFQAVVFQAE